MRYLGVDFGSKRVGLALSDEGGMIAVPHATLPNDGKLLHEVVRIARQREVAAVVFGESKDFQMRDNKIMEAARAFAEEVRKSNLGVRWHPEFMTSAQAEWGTENSAHLDASAAAVILQSFLDQERNKATKENQ